MIKNPCMFRNSKPVQWLYYVLVIMMHPEDQDT
jgi:hypothetical protein